jgi:hypothetical protein
MRNAILRIGLQGWRARMALLEVSRVIACETLVEPPPLHKALQLTAQRVPIEVW